MQGPGRRAVPGNAAGIPVPRALDEDLKKTASPDPTRWPSLLSSMFPCCGNPRCGTGRVRLWRSRRVPAFEGRWACSAQCLRVMVEAAIGREGRDGAPEAGERKHRIPLGLMLLEQGRLSERQLREAVEGQRRAAEATGEAIRLKDWLRNSGLLSEAALTRAISAQWNCPVFSLAGSRSEEMASVLPPFLAEALGALPVRVSGSRLLYLAFSERIDRSLSYAVEHITGLQVAAGMARESEFRHEQARFRSGEAPKTRFLEAGDRRALAREMAAWMEEEQPVAARLARVHEVWWLRIWRRAQPGASLSAREAVEDLLATVGTKVEENALAPIRNPEGSGATCQE